MARESVTLIATFEASGQQCKDLNIYDNEARPVKPLEQGKFISK